jgi:hypothetical protein
MPRATLCSGTRPLPSGLLQVDCSSMRISIRGRTRLHVWEPWRSPLATVWPRSWPSRCTSVTTLRSPQARPSRDCHNLRL